MIIFSKIHKWLEKREEERKKKYEDTKLKVLDYFKKHHMRGLYADDIAEYFNCSYQDAKNIIKDLAFEYPETFVKTEKCFWQ